MTHKKTTEIILIDNLNILWGDDLKRELKNKLKHKTQLKIIGNEFSLHAFETLHKELNNLKSFQFIFTKPLLTKPPLTKTASKNLSLEDRYREFYLNETPIEETNLYGTQFEVSLQNRLYQKSNAQLCVKWIKAKGRVSFRANIGNKDLQELAHITQSNDQPSVSYLPIQGFTRSSLGYEESSKTSNFISKITGDTTLATAFNQLWIDKNITVDVTEALCERLAALYQENSPKILYYFTLYHVFSNSLKNTNADNLPNEDLGYRKTKIWQILFNFQDEAAVNIISKLEAYNSCILADSVGLGKTFTALAVIKYYEMRNKSVLVLCPKRLEDNWTTYNNPVIDNILDSDKLNYKVLAHTDLDRETGKSSGIDLAKLNWGSFDLLVIDESHNFRNRAPEGKETRYSKLTKKVIHSGVKTKVLMLSATPVNNRFNDLKHQLALAYGDKPEKLMDKIGVHKSIDVVFREAQFAFKEWEQLPTEERTTSSIQSRLSSDFFSLLDAVTVARSRHHIETFYADSGVGSFPERLPTKSIDAPLTYLTEVISIEAVYNRLLTLKLALYTPFKYVHDSYMPEYIHSHSGKKGPHSNSSWSATREKGTRRVIQINLLKRLESSVESFRKTLLGLHSNYSSILDKLDNFGQRMGEFSIHEIDIPQEEFDAEYNDYRAREEFLVGTKFSINLKHIKAKDWRDDLARDLQILEDLLKSMAVITPVHDAKLQNLITHIINKTENPINPGNRKVLVFTAFADTAHYLYNALSVELAKHGLETAVVTGSGQKNRTTLGSVTNFQKILRAFSPVSKERALIDAGATGTIDILIGTDCISEGQNLQDCDYVINYDIHWNPVRIIQRFGRIDRIGSTNTNIQLVNYWPNLALDEYIKLRSRVEGRMVMANLAGTGDENLLSEDDKASDFRTEALKRLRSGEAVNIEDTRKGVGIADLGLGDLHANLLSYMRSSFNLRKLPLGIHSVIPANHATGLVPGVIFTFRNSSQALKAHTSSPIHPYYLVYVGNNGEVLFDYSRSSALLTLMRDNCIQYPDPVKSVYPIFNTETRDGFDMTSYFRILNIATGSIIDTEKSRDIDNLFSGGSTLAPENRTQGTSEFELVSFLVVKDDPSEDNTATYDTSEDDPSEGNTATYDTATYDTSEDDTDTNDSDGRMPWD